MTGVNLNKLVQNAHFFSGILRVNTFGYCCSYNWLIVLNFYILVFFMFFILLSKFFLYKYKKIVDLENEWFVVQNLTLTNKKLVLNLFVHNRQEINVRIKKKKFNSFSNKAEQR